MAAIELTKKTFEKLVACGKALEDTRADVVLEAAVNALIDKINLSKAIAANQDFANHAHPSQLHPSSFDGANAVFGPPAGMTEDEVFSLCAALIYWGGRKGILTCWKPTQGQIDEIQATGRLWLAVMGEGMVPVCLTSQNPLEFDGIELR